MSDGQVFGGFVNGSAGGITASMPQAKPPDFVVKLHNRPDVPIRGASRYQDSADGGTVFFLDPDGGLVRAIAKDRIAEIVRPGR